jgi:hypothetical protein
MKNREVKLEFEERNAKILFTEALVVREEEVEGEEEIEEVELTPKVTESNDRPPEPRLPLKSTRNESHGPIEEGKTKFTTGREG